MRCWVSYRRRGGLDHAVFQLAVGHQGADRLPAAVAGRDQRAYGEFVRQLVRHCAGRVRYWQCDNEPSNTPVYVTGPGG